MVAGLKANEAFGVVIIRKGKKETLKDVTLPEPKEAKVRKVSSSSMSVSLNGDQFDIKSQEDDLKYELKGTIGEPDTVVIVVQNGDDKKEYRGVKAVPAEHREKVEKLLKSVSK